MKKPIFSLYLLLVFLCVAGSAHATPYFGYEDFGGSWQDVNKTGSGDSRMCWAAVASNILGWGGWETQEFATTGDIFDSFVYHWVDRGGQMSYGWRWWMDGTDPGNGRIDVSGGGGYFRDYPFRDYFADFYSDYTSLRILSNDTLAYVDDYLHSGYGVGLAVYWGSYVGHGLTCWGIEYDEYNNYKGIYVTDSDDGFSGLMYYDISWRGDFWYLSGRYDGYRIGNVQALNSNPSDVAPVPEPATLALVGLGAPLVCLLRRNRPGDRS